MDLDLFRVPNNLDAFHRGSIHQTSATSAPAGTWGETRNGVRLFSEKGYSPFGKLWGGRGISLRLSRSVTLGCLNGGKEKRPGGIRPNA